MSGKLDKSLDEILSSRPRGGPAGRRRSQRRSSGRLATTAPVGGIQKTTKPTRAAAAKTAPIKAGARTSDSKVIVSNLVGRALFLCAMFTQLTTLQPRDVSEQQIKVCCR
jgi:THO complex subunit 4